MAPQEAGERCTETIGQGTAHMRENTSGGTFLQVWLSRTFPRGPIFVFQPRLSKNRALFPEVASVKLEMAFFPIPTNLSQGSQAWLQMAFRVSANLLT